MNEIDQDSLLEFANGLQLFEDTKEPDVKVVRKILYNTLTGIILGRIATEDFIPTAGLSILDLNMVDFYDPNLIKNFYVKDNTLQKKPRVRLDFSQRLLEPTPGGKFITLPGNMLFVSDKGDTYDYRH